MTKTTVTVPANGGPVEAVSTIETVPYWTRSRRRTGKILCYDDAICKLGMYCPRSTYVAQLIRATNMLDINDFVNPHPANTSLIWSQVISFFQPVRDNILYFAVIITV